MKQIFSKQLWKRGLSYGLSVAMAASLMPTVPVFAVESAGAGGKQAVLKAGTRPADGTTTTSGQPFAANTAGSQCFRIPAMITLENGDILASADARWETSKDWGGHDTIASVSSDGGNTWNYSFPFQFADSRGYADYNAATFVDSVLVQGPDGTVYCFADAQPTDYSLRALSRKTDHEGTGYITVDGKKYLALTDSWDNCGKKPTDDDETTYAFYVGDFTGSEGTEDLYAPIMKRSDNQPTDYVVDEWYNIYEKKNGGLEEATQSLIINENNEKDDETQVQQNVYYRDSMFHVYKTSYAWVISSADGGRTWKHPKNISDQVIRETGEDAFVVSPGRGLTTTKNGDIVLGDYYFNSESDQVASMIYSTDNGKTWGRTNDVNKALSSYATENEIVELKDGRLLMFYRNSTGRLCYTTVWRDTASDGEISYTISGDSVSTDVYIQEGASNCNLSAITYSKEINGKQVILVSCPAGGVLSSDNDRKNGRIFAFLVEENWSLTPIGTPFVVDDSTEMFQYSCLTELSDGSIGLLWESGSASIRFDRYSILEILPQADIDGAVIDVELEVGETWTREYTGTGEGAPVISQEITPSAPVASVEAGVGTTVNAVLYDHVNSNQAALADAFLTEPNTQISLSEMEHTFRKAGEGKWQIYNESKRLYLTNMASNGTHYYRNHPTSMTIRRIEGAEGLCFSNPEGSASNTDYRHFGMYLPGLNFNATSAITHDNNGLQNMVLLEKTNQSSGSAVLNGYEVVSEPKDGGRYLIAYIYTDTADNNAERVMVLYPVSGTSVANSVTKLVGKQSATVETDSSKKRILITGVAEGERIAVADGVTYRIHVTDPEKGNGTGEPERETKNVGLKVGESFAVQIPDEISSLSPQGAVAEVSVTEGFDVTGNLYSSKISSGNNTVLEDAADAEATNLTDLEFMFTKGSADNKWVVYNEKTSLYMKNASSNPNSYFYNQRAEMIITKPAESLGFPEASYYLITDGTSDRQLMFWIPFNAVNRSGGITDEALAGVHKGKVGLFQFLERKPLSKESDEGIMLNGYAPITEIKDGGRYLLAYTHTDGNIYILNAQDTNNHWQLQKCVKKDETELTRISNESKFLTITAKQTGYTSVAVGDVDYNIYVTDENTTYDEADRVVIEADGEYRIVFDSPTDMEIPDSEIFDLSVNGTKTRAVWKYSDGVEAPNATTAFAKNDGVTLENVEYVFTSVPESDGCYQIRLKNPPTTDAASVPYFGLLNGTAGNGHNLDFFASDARSVKVEKVEEDGQAFYKFSKVSSEGEVEDTMCFHSGGTPNAAPPDTPMVFNLTSKNLSDTDENMTLFKKNPDAVNTPLPGYERTDTIEDGGTYLIAYEWSHESDSAIFVLYPQNWIRNLVRLVGETDLYKGVTEVKITPKADHLGTEGIVLNGKLYVIEVADHSGHEHVIFGATSPMCDKNGTTGKEKCLVENRIVSEGRVIPATGHSWDDGEVTTPLAINEDGVATADGVITYTCANEQDGLAHTRTVKIYAYAYNRLKEQCDLAEAELAREGYDAQAKEMLQSVYDAKKQLLTEKTAYTRDYYLASEEMEAAIAEARRNSGIKDVESISIQLNGETPSTVIRLVKGESIQLTATVTPEDATDQTVTWTSSNPNTASVDQKGNVTGVEVTAARATITASAGGKTASVNVRVVNPTVVPDPDCTCTVENITVEPQNASIVIPVDASRGTVQLSPTVEMGGSCELDGHPKTVIYSYEVKEAGTTGATVDATSGLVTATSEGSAVIVVTAHPTTNNSSKSIEIEVEVIKAKTEEEEKQQEKEQLTDIFESAQEIYGEGEKAEYGKDAWERFKNAYEEADAFLKLSAEEQDQKTTEEIRNLKNELKEAQAELLKQVPAGKKVEAITVTAAKTTLAPKETTTATAVVKPDDAENKTVTWTSSNPAIATVGAATGVITAVAAGEADIIATAADGSGVTGKVTVKVTDAGGSVTPPTTTGLTVGTDYKVGNVVYTAVTNQTITIKKGVNQKTVKIPATQKINGTAYKVVGIEANAFKNCKKVKSVVIGSNVTSIKSKAFVSCTKLTTVTIGAKVTKIAKNAFYKCSKIKKISFKGAKLPSMKKAFSKTAANVVVSVKKSLRKTAAKKKKALGTLKKAGIKVTLKNIK